MFDPLARYPLPWRAEAELVVAANGSPVARACAFDPLEGVRWEIDQHAAMCAAAINVAWGVDERKEDPKEASDDIAVLQAEVVQWADAQLGPERASSAAFMKLFEELGEVVAAPDKEMEWADVFIMLLDLAYMFGVTDLAAAIRRKTEINKRRHWVRTSTGVMKGSNPLEVVK